MKKLLVIWSSVLVIALRAGIAFPMGFCKDIAPTEPSDKTFDDEWTIIGVPGTITVDIWINDIPEPIIAAGLWFDFDPSMVSVTSVKIYDNYDLPGPWEPGFSGKYDDPGGPGTYMLVVGSLAGVPPDTDGDFIIARMEFECLDAGITTIRLLHPP